MTGRGSFQGRGLVTSPACWAIPEVTSLPPTSKPCRSPASLPIWYVFMLLQGVQSTGPEGHGTVIVSTHVEHRCVPSPHPRSSSVLPSFSQPRRSSSTGDSQLLATPGVTCLLSPALYSVWSLLLELILSSHLCLVCKEQFVVHLCMAECGPQHLKLCPHSPLFPTHTCARVHTLNRHLTFQVCRHACD